MDPKTRKAMAMPGQMNRSAMWLVTEKMGGESLRA
jgi:hypothetical protein